MDKKLKHEIITIKTCSEIDSLSELIDDLTEIQKTSIDRGYEGFTVEFREGCYVDSDELVIFGYRLESDQEYKQRLEREEKRKKAWQEEQIAQATKLLKESGYKVTKNKE